MTFHQRILSQLRNIIQVTLPVEIPQYYQLQPHQSFYWRSLFHLQLLIPVYLLFRSLKISHRSYLLRTHQRNLSQFQLLLPVMLPVKIPQVSQQYSNLKFRQRSIPLFLLLLPVPFPVNTTQSLLLSPSTFVIPSTSQSVPFIIPYYVPYTALSRLS